MQLIRINISVFIMMAAETLYRINVALPTGIVRVGFRGQYKFTLTKAQAIADDYKQYGYKIHFTPAREPFSLQRSL
ncbi:hypothetical protein [Photobacterium minamisatsumaniensis]|uniref:hypothetical protein n=1 Tax=Photobacterium minamisatsumaniensis TaxID=2910233 RepID=UPI003D0B67B3